jgi:hypothetical protein
MTDISIMKSADSETIKQRVKAIYPHIVVSGDIDKPYYSIHWYDIEKEEMYCGFSSYKLELVRKWLEEEFEVVEADIDNLINRQKAEIEELESEIDRQYEQAEADILGNLPHGGASCHWCIDKHKAYAFKKFADRLQERCNNQGGCLYASDIGAELKEMVGEKE